MKLATCLKLVGEHSDMIMATKGQSPCVLIDVATGAQGHIVLDALKQYFDADPERVYYDTTCMMIEILRWRDIRAVEELVKYYKLFTKCAGETIAEAEEKGVGMSCPLCNKEIKGFRDPLSIKEYKINGTCQECQDRVLGTDHKQICEVCGKRVALDDAIIMSNYAVCSDDCARSLVGL